MKKLLLILCLTSALLDLAVAAEPAPPRLELKRKSSFDATDTRDPFWPIGWKKPNPKSSNSEGGPGLSAESFSLTSVVTGGGEHFAILNGKILQEGQQFGIQFGSQIYQVTLRTIEDGQVVLAYQDSEITVPLRRR